MINADKCCGCEACKHICPVNAIEIVQSAEGVDIPLIHKERCINCGLCEQVCPMAIEQNYEQFSPDIYAVQINDEKKCLGASSGGTGPAVYDYFISHSGIVYGAAFTKDFEVQHIRCENYEEVQHIVGSKYVQSKMGDIYTNLETDLSNGKQVCFVGTPCQNQAVRNYLQTKKVSIDNLYCIDFLCHGVASPMVWENYIRGLEKETGQKIRSVNFRDKRQGWSTPNLKIEFTDQTYKKPLGEEPYYICFIKNYILRESCYRCPYASPSRPGDITMGDFWGAEERFSKVIKTELGVSLVMLNTLKGKLLWEKIKNNCWNEKIDKSMFYQRALHLPALRPPKRKEFWDDYFSAENKIDVIRKYGAVNRIFYRVRLMLVRLAKKAKIYHYCVTLVTGAKGNEKN